MVDQPVKIRHRPHHAPRFRTLQLRDEGVTTLPLCGYRQARDYTCGFASTLMVLHYFAAKVPALELFRRLGTGRDGTRQSAIVRELRAAGLRANVRYDMDFARVCRMIDHNKLIIGYLGDVEHWVVIYGYGRDPERVYVADPEPDQECSQEWSTYCPRLGDFGIVCSRPGDTVVVQQAPLSLVGEPRPALRKPPPQGRLRCEVSCKLPDELPDDEREQLALPFSSG